MSRPTPALVVDADPRGLEALAYGFQGEGWQPTLTPDYASAHDTAARGESQLAVVVIRDPSGPGLTALRELRGSNAGTPLPVLVLGPESLRQEVRAIAGADFLPLPAFVRDVITASKLLTAVYQASGTTADEAGFVGSLSEYGLFFLVRTMVSLGRSGILQIERANRKGEIRFSDGEVIGATVGSLQGTSALHHLLLWEEAAIDLKLRSNVHRGSFSQRPEELIEEAERFLRDFAHATKDLGPTATVLRADLEKAASAGGAVPAEVSPLVRLFDGQRTLGDVIEDSPFRVFDTLRIASRLMDLGILRRQGPPPEAARPAPATPTIKIMPEPIPAPVVPAATNLAGAPAPAQQAGPPEGEPPPPKDHRTGASNRRKLQRRDRGSSEQRTLTSTPPLETIAPPDSQKEPTAASPKAEQPTTEQKPIETAPAPAAGELRASGTIGAARGELRGGGRQVPKPVDAPSVVIDMGGAAPPVEAPAATPPSAATAKAVGVMQARPSAAIPTAPAAPSGFSIEVDPALMAEMAAHDAAKATPPPVLKPAPAPAAAAAPAPAPVAPARVTNGAAPAPAPAAAHPAHAAPEPGKRALRPSSEFDALERDFFAREADLYKQEHPETFDDLDHGRPKNGSR
jgi:ActR/RegA family two-component response regulator